MLDEHLDRAGDLLAEMLFTSNFAEADVTNERGVIREEMDMYADTPEDLVTERLIGAAFPGDEECAHMPDEYAEVDKLMLAMTTAPSKDEAFKVWEQVQEYCYADYCPILMMGHFHQAAACTSKLTGYNVFLTTNFWNARLAK